jgi:uncharacterized protein YmfQ (DUF2313 family)
VATVFAAVASLGVDAYARHLKQLLPPGVAWNLEPDSNLSKLLTGIADECARIDGRGAALIDETDPRTTFELLTDWERVLGLPNPCVTTEQTVAQRRAAVLAQVQSLGGATPAYSIVIAAALGYTITVTEFSPFDVDDDVDTPLYSDDWAFAWQVNGPLNTIGELGVDDDVDEPLAWWGNAALECVMVRLKPAHTLVMFSYS